MGKYEVRRLALVKYVNAAGGNDAIEIVAEKCKINPSYMSKLLYPPDRRGAIRLSETVVLKIEMGLGKIFHASYSASRDMANFSNSMLLSFYNGMNEDHKDALMNFANQMHSIDNKDTRG